MMKVGILTSSRADFGIYIPLLEKFLCDSEIDFEIIAFGTHLSRKYGNTINEILSKGYEVKHKLDTLPKNDSPKSISASIGDVITKFSAFWNNNNFDIVIALGDRYEMFAAVLASTPFSIKVAHIAGGETTLGAIDNSYRHGISLMSNIIFTSTEVYKKRAIELKGSTSGIYNVGALNIDNLVKEDLYSLKEFKEKYNINLETPTILVTFHPETVDYMKNAVFIKELLSALEVLEKKYQLVITMPNSDTMGLMVREEINKFGKKFNKVFLVESFGMKGYLSCMKYCSFMLGNTSSGFVEASFFSKWVINIGNRQEGRLLTPNIKSIKIEKASILDEVSKIEISPSIKVDNFYGNGNASTAIIDILKK